jgi:uncharacterized membrane-anchored protein
VLTSLLVTVTRLMSSSAPPLFLIFSVATALGVTLSQFTMMDFTSVVDADASNSTCDVFVVLLLKFLTL